MTQLLAHLRAGRRSQVQVCLTLVMNLAMAQGGTAKADGDPPGQPSYSADAFTHFVGINGGPITCYVILDGPYAGAGRTYDPRVFYDLGIRYYRTVLFNELTLENHPDQVRKAWETHGVRAMLLISPTRTRTIDELMVKLKRFTPESVAEVEGANEVNNKFPPQVLNLHYAGKTDEAAGAAYMTEVYRAIKADPQTKSIPVIAYTAIFTDYALARGYDAFDFGNIHSYQGYNVPSSSLLMNETRANNVLPPGATIRPFVPTECGYNVEVDRSNGTYKTGSHREQALNIPMLLAEYFRHGIRRAYLFSLDNGDGYGLIESDLKTRRPCYFAVKNLLAEVKDSDWNARTHKWEGGDGFAPRSLLFTLEGAPATVHTLTLQKKSGAVLAADLERGSELQRGYEEGHREPSGTGHASLHDASPVHGAHPDPDRGGRIRHPRGESRAQHPPSGRAVLGGDREALASSSGRSCRTRRARGCPWDRDGKPHRTDLETLALAGCGGLFRVPQRCPGYDRSGDLV